MDGVIVQDVRAVNGFAYGVIGADLHVFSDGSPVYLLLVWRRPPAPSPDWLRELPSRLLNARHRVVGFTGRQAELEDLRRWRDGAARLSMQWLHGPGGQGKTRLADEAAEQAVAAGWLVVTAVHGPGQVHPPPGSQDLGGKPAGVLLIVDYADRWPLSHLIWLLNNALLHRTEMPARVLLLGRTDAARPGLELAAEQLAAEMTAQYLSPLDQRSGARTLMYEVARASFARQYGVEDSSTAIGYPDALDDEEMGLTLALHMAALVAVDAHTRGLQSPNDAAGLTLYLLDREHLHWSNLADGGAQRLPELAGPVPRYGTDPADMNRLVFLAALTGALPQEPAIELVERLLPDLSDPPARLTDHAVCYPPAMPGLYCEPLYPDRLAEDFLALTLIGHSADYPAQEWAEAMVRSLLTRAVDESAPPWTRRVVSGLAAAAARWPHVGPGHLYPALAEDPLLAVEAGGEALTALASVPDVDLTLLAAIEPHLPKHRHVDLDVAALAVVSRLAEVRIDTLTDVTERADAHANLGYRLSLVGLGEESDEHYELAVRLYREAAASGGRKARDDLAQALINVCYTRMDTGRRGEALEPIEEAIVVYRELAQVDPQEFDPDLAYALITLGTVFARLGRYEEAAATCAESTSVYRHLAASEPKYAEDLAAACGNTGLWLHALGRYEQSLPLVREARGIYEQLYATDPDSYSYDLGLALVNEGTSLHGLRRYHETVSVWSAAVDLVRPLCQTRPDTFEPVLATALGNLSEALGQAGRPLDALAASAESVEIQRRLAAARPAAHQPDLATSLNNHSADLLHAGRTAEALAAAEEATSIRRGLFEAYPDAFRSLLASALVNQSEALRITERSADAVYSAQEAVGLYREVISAGHEATVTYLAAALHVLAQAFLASGRAEESLEAEEECVRIRRQIAAGLDLAASLVVLGQALTAVGRQDVARAAAEEAIGLFERLQDTTEAAAQVAEGLAQARTLRAAFGPASHDDSQRC